MRHSQNSIIEFHITEMRGEPAADTPEVMGAGSLHLHLYSPVARINIVKLLLSRFAGVSLNLRVKHLLDTDQGKFL
jgi:hypothetical protein